jgi:hypothetical protein
MKMLKINYKVELVVILLLSIIPLVSSDIETQFYYGGEQEITIDLWGDLEIFFYQPEPISLPITPMTSGTILVIPDNPNIPKVEVEEGNDTGIVVAPSIVHVLNSSLYLSGTILVIPDNPNIPKVEVEEGNDTGIVVAPSMIR